VYWYSPNARLDIQGTQISENAATGSWRDGTGGGVHIYAGSVALQGSQLINNTAEEGGGGVFVAGGGSTGVLTATDSVLVGNSAAWGGGIYNESLVFVHRSSLIDNWAFSDGGGIYSEDPLEIVNSTVSGNYVQAGSGGAIYVSGATALTYTTVVSNSASGVGGIYSGGPTTLHDTLLAYNDTNCGGSLTSRGYNLDDGDSCGLDATGDITDTDPLLMPLTYQLGTWAHIPFPGSPAIDAGMCVAGVPVDQIGQSRVSPCDMGAIESQWHRVYLPLVVRGIAEP
jgi:hypothetical protein